MPHDAERRSFLDAIIANPEDDAARLAYADFLDTIGEAKRAEFIRVQIELSRFNASQHFCSKTRIHLPSLGSFVSRCRCRICWLRRKEYWILRRNAKTWHRTAYAAARAEWVRGFLRKIECYDMPMAKTLLPTIVRDHPLEVVHVIGCMPMPLGHLFPPPMRGWLVTESESCADGRVSRSVAQYFYDPPRPVIEPITFPSLVHAVEGLSKALIRWARANPPATDEA